MERVQAEVIGLQALTHMAKYEEILIAYIELSGITPEELRNSADNPATLGSILDYFLQNEKKLISFCQAENIEPEQISKARQLLPGGLMLPSST